MKLIKYARLSLTALLPATIGYKRYFPPFFANFPLVFFGNGNYFQTGGKLIQNGGKFAKNGRKFVVPNIDVDGRLVNGSELHQGITNRTALFRTTNLTS